MLRPTTVRKSPDAGTSRISRNALATAVRKVQAMDFAQQERLVDELFHAQPHVLASFLVQQKLGVSAQKMDFLIRIMLICFQAMKESGLTWPRITEDEQERQMNRLSGSIAFGGDLPADLRDQALRQYLTGHPEKDLLAFVNYETADWLQRVEPEESDKFVLMAALNFVDCIAYVPLPLPAQPAASRSKRKR
jgi:hypothetical protein